MTERRGTPQTIWVEDRPVTLELEDIMDSTLEDFLDLLSDEATSTTALEQHDYRLDRRQAGGTSVRLLVGGYIDVTKWDWDKETVIDVLAHIGHQHYRVEFTEAT